MQTLKISTILLGLSIADLQCRVGGVRTAPGDPIIYSFMYFMIGLEATPPPQKEKLARQSSGLHIRRLPCSKSSALRPRADLPLPLLS